MSYEPTVWVDGDHVTSAKLNKLEQGVNSMSYTPTVWNAGDVVTAEKLNKLEQGVAEGGGGGATFPTFTRGSEGWECDITYAEAKAVWEEYKDAALPNTAPCLLADTWSSYLVLSGEDFAGTKDLYEGVPADMTEGILAWNTEFEAPPFIFGSDGNFYLPVSSGRD